MVNKTKIDESRPLPSFIGEMQSHEHNGQVNGGTPEAVTPWLQMRSEAESREAESSVDTTCMLLFSGVFHSPERPDFEAQLVSPNVALLRDWARE